MYYYKKGGTYVASHVKISTADEITESEYNEIREIIRNRPTAPDGYGYRLTEDLQWELYELPTEEETDEELTDSEALNIIVNGGGVNA